VKTLFVFIFSIVICSCRPNEGEPQKKNVVSSSLEVMPYTDDNRIVGSWWSTADDPTAAWGFYSGGTYMNPELDKHGRYKLSRGLLLMDALDSIGRIDSGYVHFLGNDTLVWIGDLRLDENLVIPDTAVYFRGE
jgi:hypothetical protein